MYKNLGPQKSTFLLFGVSVAVCIPVIAFYFYGPEIREKSAFAQKLQKKREERATAKDNLARASRNQRDAEAIELSALNV
jgi:endonuclease V-like protein UPF0215 family